MTCSVAPFTGITLPDPPALSSLDEAMTQLLQRMRASGQRYGQRYGRARIPPVLLPANSVPRARAPPGESTAALAEGGERSAWGDTFRTKAVA